jgi:hypothetical protein
MKANRLGNPALGLAPLRVRLNKLSPGPDMALKHVVPVLADLGRMNTVMSSRRPMPAD